MVGFSDFMACGPVWAESKNKGMCIYITGMRRGDLDGAVWDTGKSRNTGEVSIVDSLFWTFVIAF